MQFSSKTPRDLNHDPEPYLCDRNHRHIADDGEYLRAKYDPRPEFDHVQHNEPNPILVAFRGYSDGHGMDADDRTNLARAWLQAPRYYEGRLVALRRSKRHQDHARRVLTRISRINEGVKK